MDLVNDIDFVAALRWRVTHVVAQLAHLLDPVVAGAVNLENIKAVPGCDLLAVIAHATRSRGRPMDAIERLRQDARGRSFPDPTWTDKEIGMREPVLFDRIS